MSAKTRSTRRKKPAAQRGFSMMQLIVTLAVVSVVSGLAVMGIASARQRIRLTNSSRVLASWAEKARVDSVRRHPTDPDQMSGIEVLNKTTYRVKMDFDGNGTVETRDVTLDDGVEFATDPIALVFDWRGRLVDLPTTEIKVSIALQWGDDADDQRLVDITRSGDVTLDSDVYLDDVPNVNAIGPKDKTDGGSTDLGDNTPNATPTPTPAAEQSPTPNASPTPEVIDLPPFDGGGVEPTPEPTPESDATPTPTATPAATPSASPGTNPSPTPTPCVVTTSTSPSPLSFSKHSGGTVSFSVNPNGTVEFTDGPNNISVNRISGNSFAIASLNNSRGNFTLTFNTPCGSQSVSVTIVN